MACPGTCGECRFALGFPEASEPPSKPEPPKGWFARLFWSDPAGDIWSEHSFDLRRHRDEVNAHQNLVKCRRYPGKAPTMRKAATCGEFQAVPA